MRGLQCRSENRGRTTESLSPSNLRGRFSASSPGRQLLFQWRVSERPFANPRAQGDRMLPLRRGSRARKRASSSVHAQLDDHAAKSAAEKLYESRMPGWCVRDPGTCRSAVIPGGLGVDFSDRISLGQGRGRAKACKIRHPKKLSPGRMPKQRRVRGLRLQSIWLSPQVSRFSALKEACSMRSRRLFPPKD
jgi:hypothetical protein